MILLVDMDNTLVEFNAGLLRVCITKGNVSETVRFYAPSEVSIEQLRVILEERSGARVSFEDAEEIGIQLVSLYECLARERNDAEAA